MTTRDLIGLIASYVYATGMLISVQLIGKRLKWPAFTTRKIIHIGAGLWVFGILALFDTWYIGIIPFASFIVINWILYRTRLLDMMDEPDSSPGTIYFALSITLLFLLLWRTGPAPADATSPPNRVAIAVAAVMAMTLGDAMAALLGKRFGKRKYTFFGHTRTWEGTAAFVFFGGIAIFLSLALLPNSALAPEHISLWPIDLILMTTAGTLVGAAAEAVSPAGTDNLSVPLLSALAMWLVWMFL